VFGVAAGDHGTAVSAAPQAFGRGKVQAGGLELAVVADLAVVDRTFFSKNSSAEWFWAARWGENRISSERPRILRRNTAMIGKYNKRKEIAEEPAAP
jgi:hypothetical protein